MADWYHNTSAEIIAGLDTPRGYHSKSPAPPPIWPCSADSEPGTARPMALPRPASHRNRTSSRPIRTRRTGYASNTAAHAMIWNSIDNHTLSVIEADDTPISSPAVNDLHRVKSHNGQRYSVTLGTDQEKSGDRFWMWGEMSAQCFGYVTKDFAITALAVLRLVTPATTDLPTRQDWAEALGTSCRDIDTEALVPLVKEDAPSIALQQGSFNTQFGIKNTTNGMISKFYANKVAFDQMWYRPMLHDAVEGRDVKKAHVASLTLRMRGRRKSALTTWTGLIIRIICTFLRSGSLERGLER